MVFRYPRVGNAASLVGAYSTTAEPACAIRSSCGQTTGYGHRAGYRSSSPKWIIFYDPPPSPAIRIEEQRKMAFFPMGMNCLSVPVK